VPPLPPDVITVPRVIVNIQADPGVEVLVQVNGEPWESGF
jgi:hypothetical protein